MVAIHEENLKHVQSLGFRGQTDSVSLVDWQGGRYVFKRYSAEAIDSLNVHLLEAHIEWRNSLDLRMRADLDKIAAWPVSLVRSSDKVIGVLVSAAPLDFWDDSGGRLVPRDCLRYAINADRGSFNDEARFEVAGRLLESVRWLHGLGVVVGDLQYGNILVSEARRTYLIDMDSSVLNGVCPFGERYEPAWAREPCPRDVHWCGSDWYKYARVALALVYGDNAIREIDGSSDYFSAYDRKVMGFLLAGDFDDGQGVLHSVGQRWVSGGSTRHRPVSGVGGSLSNGGVEEGDAESIEEGGDECLSSASSSKSGGVVARFFNGMLDVFGFLVVGWVISVGVALVLGWLSGPVGRFGDHWFQTLWLPVSWLIAAVRSL